jgi:nicotinate (nicotinamide) nucleotide adenylyltransferase
MEDEPVEKRQRLEKYPFVDYDGWIIRLISNGEGKSFTVCSGSAALSSSNGNVPLPARPPTEWFTLSIANAISPQSHSAQYSTVAHSPIRPAESKPSDDKSFVYFSNEEAVKNYLNSRQSIPHSVAHPWNHTALYREAQMYDVLSNACRRDPALYKSSVSRIGEIADFLVAKTIAPGTSRIDRMPWSWERENRRSILKEIIACVTEVASKGDCLIPMRGLICSAWLVGILFRLTQLFFKITAVKSQLCPKWDDAYFIFCQGKRESSKLVDKSLRLLEKLYQDSSNETDRWGYSVPPLCFTDPNLVEWVKRINAQLIGAKGVEDENISIEKFASITRIKKYLFPESRQRLVGFYFGSFSPVHENHIALAQFAVDHLGFDQVWFVPNEDGNQDKEESDVVASPHRIAMLQMRATSLEWMKVMKPSKSTRRWESKAEIAQEKSTELFFESQDTGIPALLLGEDSWNKAVMGSSRDKTTRHFIGIAKLTAGIKFYVFPRSSEEDPYNILHPPKPIRDLVTIVKDYKDAIPSLSSSQIRQRVAQPNIEQIEGLHPTVFEYIRTNKLYI